MELVRNLFGVKMSGEDKTIFAFGDFRLDPASLSLWRNGELVGTPPKAVETLVQLVSARGEIVSRETLLNTVWKDTFVEEGNINYTISLLRKTLEDRDVIQTVPRRGYRFTSEVREVITNGSKAQAEIVSARSHRWVFISVLTVCVLLLTSFMWFAKWPIVPSSERAIRSVAVLPLKNLSSPNADDDLFSVGIADLLISRLGSLNRFAVRPIDAVVPFGRSADDPLAFGARLHADAVFTGTFHRENDRVFVNARLLDVRDGAQIWAGQFDEAETDVFQLQEKIATEITRSVSKDLGENDKRMLAKRGTENPEAHRAYIRGRAIFDQKIPNKFERAAAEFQAAITLDPTYSLAYAGMADALSRQGNDATGAEATAFYSKSRVYAQRALELDPESPEAYVAAARIKRLADWDWTGAEQDFQRALSLNPNNADAYLFYGQMLGFLGRFDEAISKVDQASSINPISATARGAKLAILESKGDFFQALRLADEYREESRDNPNAIRAAATFRLHTGDFSGVIEIGEAALAKNIGPEFAWCSLLAAAYLRAGHPDKAAAMISRLEKLAATDTKALYSLAVNYGELGRADEAIAALEKCFSMHEERMVWLNVEPRFTPLRSDPRFADLVRRMNLSS